MKNTYVTKKDLENYEEQKENLWKELSEIEQKELMEKANKMIDKYVHFVGIPNAKPKSI